MDFKIRANVYKKTAEDHKRRYKDGYDPSKKYPTHGPKGPIDIPLDQAKMLAEYLIFAQQTELEYSEYHGQPVIRLDLSGYASSEKANPDNKYLGLTLSPHYQTLQAAQEAKERHVASAQKPAATGNVEVAAASLAKATDGEVTPGTFDIDIF